MNLKTEWDTLRRRIEEVFHPASHHESGADGSAQDEREWVVIYRTATGFCCMYKGLPVNFEDMLDVQIWTEEMDVRPYFMGL
ncbi:hypothetical protein [Paraburkholderia heleia]|uniref:hypothetical protein n=1 Tax=Paraburkholderia heleia TaxID=634127 RepID=UPI0006940F23|nr:hypothetical protein [Paraburkholderia heleia]